MYNDQQCAKGIPEKTPQTKDQLIALRNEAELCLEFATQLGEKLRPLIVQNPECSSLQDIEKSCEHGTKPVIRLPLEQLCPFAENIKDIRAILSNASIIIHRLNDRVEI